jgi:hypothetical protein
MADTNTPPFPGPPFSPLGHTEIRLVEIHPGEFDDPIAISINSVDLANNPSYDALSYVWDPQDGTINPTSPVKPALVINHDSYPINLGPNLDAAIRYLRLKPDSLRGTQAPQILWIDALCINQEIVLERNHQVGLMKTIYSSAQRVLIWLGPPQNDSDLVIDALRTGHLDSLNLLRFIDSLELLLRRSWFGRVWIAQELTLSSQSPTVHVGFQTISWDAFSVAIRSVWTRLCAKEELLCTGGSQYLECFTKTAIWGLGDAVYPPALEARAEVVQQLIDMRNSGPSTPFNQQFFRTIYLQAKDSRDKVFGLLGFSSFKRSPITADYTKPISRVFAEAAATIMQDDFYTYVDLQLWSYRILGGDSWAN